MKQQSFNNLTKLVQSFKQILKF